MSLQHSLERQCRKLLLPEYKDENSNVDVYVCNVFNSAGSMLCLRMARPIQDDKQRVFEPPEGNGKYTLNLYALFVNCY